MGFRSMRVGRPRGKRGANAYPLRRVISETAFDETLECGHTIAKRIDFVGYTCAVRRRCKQCFVNSRSSLQSSEGEGD
jgi:hypothetical protein